MIRLSQGPKPQILLDKGEEWTTAYVQWCDDGIGTEPRHYAHADIRTALEEETNSKCAYCEGRINDVAYTHIEHKLPKRKNPTLVCEWDNLTIACPKCNTKKGDYDDKACPLLDPYVDDVESHVVFYGPMAFACDSASAQATIALLELNRSDLLFSRKSALEGVDRLISLIERASGNQAVAQALWLDVELAISAGAEFASACRHFVQARLLERGLDRP